MTHDSTQRFAAAVARFDAANAQDPNHVTVAGADKPRELWYAEQLSACVDRLCPAASEGLRLAARCQHLCRWEIPRKDFPSTRAGYLRWRQRLKEFHAERSAQILRDVGYAEDMVAQVRDLNLKRHLGTDPETQVLEDALCLVFLEHQLADLAAKSTEEQVINALRKSWAKMSPAGRAAAERLQLGDPDRALLRKALEGPRATPAE